jgi:hypothetical protein
MAPVWWGDERAPVRDVISPARQGRALLIEHDSASVLRHGSVPAAQAMNKAPDQRVTGRSLASIRSAVAPFN